MTFKEEEGEFDTDHTLFLNGDGSAKFISTDGEQEEVTEGKWQETGSGVKLTDGIKMTFKDDNGGLTAKILGVDLHFEKE